MPPQAIELEEAVLGALLLEKDAYMLCADILKPECFYKEQHEKIYRAIQTLNSKDLPVDMLTVAQELRSKNILEEVGGAYYITQLTGHVASAAHIEYHARIIFQKYIARVSIRLSSELQFSSYDESIDADELIDQALKLADKLSNIGVTGNKILPYDQNVNNAMERVKERSVRAQNNESIGLAPPLLCQQKFISHYPAGHLAIIAARPAMGKTSVALSYARYFAANGVPGLIFEAEMTKEELTDRNICSIAEIDPENYKNGNLTADDWERVEYAASTSLEHMIFIDDTSNPSLAHVKKEAKLHKMKYDIGWIILDYIGIMDMTSSNKNFSKNDIIGDITSGLKSLAKDLGLPIIALAQLNRDNEKRAGEGKRPQLSDLRDSGNIEQDADSVMFIHRPAYYGQLEDSQGNSLLRAVEFIFTKNRGGSVGIADADTNEYINEFYDLGRRSFSGSPSISGTSPHEIDKPF